MDEREKVHEKCNGCKRVDENDECVSYIKPSIWWRHDRICPLASHHSLAREDGKTGKVRVGQQKQKKRR